MGHKVSRHKSYAVCRVDGLPGQYRVIRPSESYGSQLDNNARSYGGKYPNHDPGVTADRKYVTAINDIGSKGIRSHGGETKSNGAISPKSKPKPKPRKKKDVSSTEKINGLQHHEQPCPSKRKESPKKERDSVERRSNGSTINANATTNQRIAQNGYDSHSNGSAVLERPQRVVPRASSSVGDERKQKVSSHVNSSLADERKQKTITPGNSKADDTRQQRDHSFTFQHQLIPSLHDNKSFDNEPIPVSNVDSPYFNKVSEKPHRDVEISPTDLSDNATAPKTNHDTQMMLSQSESTTNSSKIIASESVVKDCDESRYTVVSVVVHQPFAKPEPSDIPEVVLNGGQECLSDQEEVEQGSQVMFDDEPVDVAMFERVNSTRNSQVKKSVAFSDECVDIEHDLSQSYSRNGFHEKMDSVYGTTVRQNNGDKWVTLDATDATDFALIQRQKVPGQSILKKSKHPQNNVPALDLKESFDKSADFKTLSKKKKSDVAWDHIEGPSNPYPQGMVPVPAPRGRMKGYHRPHNEEMSKIKASNGTLADYIKQKSTNSYQATKQIHINPTSNGINHSIVVQNGGRRPQSSLGHHGDMSSRYMTSPRSTSADPRSRTLSPSRADARGRIVVQDGHVRKIVNGIDPAIHYMHSPRGEDNATLDSRTKQRQEYPPKQQSVKLVVSSGKQKPSNKKQHKQLLQQPKQQRNMIRQQWMVGNL